MKDDEEGLFKYSWMDCALAIGLTLFAIVVLFSAAGYLI
jgi:hypothetical protein